MPVSLDVTAFDPAAQKSSSFVFLTTLDPHTIPGDAMASGRPSRIHAIWMTRNGGGLITMHLGENTSQPNEDFVPEIEAGVEITFTSGAHSFSFTGLSDTTEPYQDMAVPAVVAFIDAIRNGDPVTVTLRYNVQTQTTLAVDAGDDFSLGSGQTAVLEGSAVVQNPQGDTTYAWAKVSGVGGALNDATLRRPTFTGPTLAQGTANRVLVYELTATNNGVSATARVTITVMVPAAPTTITADAGPDRVAISNSPVVLEGSAVVQNPQGDTTYAWAKVSGVGGALNDATLRRPTFTGPVVGPNAIPVELVYRLTATNNGVSDTDDVRITLLPSNTRDFYIPRDDYPAYEIMTNPALMQAELEKIEAGFNRLVDPAGREGQLVTINDRGTGYDSVRKEDLALSGQWLLLRGATLQGPLLLTEDTPQKALEAVSKTFAEGVLALRFPGHPRLIPNSLDQFLIDDQSKAQAVHEYTELRDLRRFLRPGPGVPGQPQLVSRTANSLTLRCDAPTGRTAPTLYRWRYSTDNVLDGNDPTVTSTGREITMTGLAGGTDYWVDVRAENDSGESAYSSALPTSTTATPLLDVALDVLAVTEGRSVTIQVRLSAQPTGTVTVRASEADADISLNPSLRLFTVEDWDQYQEFTVQAEHDQDREADTATVTLNASGGGVTDSATVRVDITDDDTVVTTTRTVSRWRRGTSPPSRPSGGTSTAGHVPSGWSTLALSATATQNSYYISRTETLEDGVFVSATAWSEPALWAEKTGVTTQVTANAGRNKTVNSGGTVTLNGSASVSNGQGSTTYRWSPSRRLNNRNVAQPTFTAPTIVAGGNDQRFTYTLTATNNGVSDTDIVTVTVKAPVVTNQAPNPPTNFGASRTGRSYGITFAAPSSGPTPTRYRVEYVTSRSKFGTVYAYLGGRPDAPYPYTWRLTAGNNPASNSLRVRAENAHGASAWTYTTAYRG